MDIVIDYGRLDRLIRSFHVLTGYRIAFYDTSFRKIIHYPGDECAYCAAIRAKSVAEGLDECQKSDEEAFAHCLLSNELYCYTCYAGLNEAAISLLYKGTVVGHIMFGQISTVKDKRRRYAALAHNLDGLGLSEKEKRRMTNEITYQSKEQIEAASTLLVAIGKYALSEKLFSFKKNDFIEKLDAYIDAHMPEKITSQKIADYLSVSRTALYEIARGYLKVGISDYVQMRRLEKAKELLSETDDKITEIAAEVGFGDYNYFGRVFREKTGVTASEFRRNAQK